MCAVLVLLVVVAVGVAAVRPVAVRNDERVSRRVPRSRLVVLSARLASRNTVLRCT